MIPTDLDPNWFEKLLASEKWLLLGKVASGLAHDINNPVMVIQNYISLLLEDIAELDQVEVKKNDHYTQDFNEILDQCKQLTKITQSLLRFSHMNTRKSHKFDIDVLLQNALHLMNPIFSKYKINVHLTYPPEDLSDHLFPDEIQQVFMIILENAVDSLNLKNEGRSFDKISKEIKISVSLEKDSGHGIDLSYLFISIYDNGVGIPAEQIPKIFHPFYTTKIEIHKHTNSKNFKGSGLGLAFAKHIIEKYHGQISVFSEYQEFAQFSVKIPIYRTKGENLPEIVF